MTHRIFPRNSTTLASLVRRDLELACMGGPKRHSPEQTTAKLPEAELNQVSDVGHCCIRRVARRASDRDSSGDGRVELATRDFSDSNAACGDACADAEGEIKVLLRLLAGGWHHCSTTQHTVAEDASKNQLGEGRLAEAVSFTRSKLVELLPVWSRAMKNSVDQPSGNTCSHLCAYIGDAL